jgi:hypothetical protein
MFLFSLVSAGDCGNNFIGTFKQHDVIQLRQTCDTCTYVNISSITLPDSNILYKNDAMTKQGIDFNYSFYDSTLIGTYYYSVAGDKDAGFETETFCFDITPSGKGEYGNMIFFIILFVIFAGIIIWGVSIKHEWITIIGCFGLFVFGLYNSINGIGGYKDNITNAISLIFMFGSLALGIETARNISL